MNTRYLTLSLVVLLLGSYGVYVYYKTPNPSNNQVVQTEKYQHPEGWLEYFNAEYKFSLAHPSGIVVKKFDEGGGATTFTFEDEKAGLGFQIFVVPYPEAQVSEERFLKDSPSGVRQELKEIVVDGVIAASFIGRNIILGDTREIWFIKNGFLFEVTTPKELDSWLSEIMESWRFTE